MDDIDNDGWDDLLVTYFGSNVLCGNRRARFEDASDGLAQPARQRHRGPGAHRLTKTRTACWTSLSLTIWTSIQRRHPSPAPAASARGKGFP